MASVLKRKGGPGEVANTPKRVKSAEIEKTLDSNASQSTVQLSSRLDLSKSGWDAAFGVPPPTQEVAIVNGINGDHKTADGSGSEAIDYDELYSTSKQARQERQKATTVAKSEEFHKLDWKVSKSIGGRMIDLDPVFVDGERYVVYLQKSLLSPLLYVCILTV